MGSVFVTNKNEFQHEDRFDGEDFVFRPGEKVLIPEDAAQHMFGRGMADKSDTLSRLGWGLKFDPKTGKVGDDPDGVRKLANFVFEDAVLVSKSSLERHQPEIA